MNISDLAVLLTLAVPPASLAGIAVSATARRRTVRWVAGVLGWIGWLTTVAVGVFFGLVVVAFSCWSIAHGTGCGSSSVGFIVVTAIALAAMPGVFAYRFSSRDTP